MSTPVARVLVVDDEPAMLENCERLLGRAGYTVRSLADPAGVGQALTEFAPDVLLLDLRMPGVDGFTVLPAALACDRQLAVVIMTAHATVASAVQAIREGAFDYLTKPFTGEQLVVTVERAARHRGLVRENAALRARVGREPTLDAVIGASPQLMKLLNDVRRVAATDASVLVTGESGTGKELVARCLHALGERRDGPFVPIDCAALPEPLLESELFGHEKGAFTGAAARRTGLLVQADGGTAFLDEVGELGPGLQAKLLRTLEERTVRPVGGSALVRTEFRLLAATNVDLEEAVAAGRFRADLFYRLHVVRLHVPPLRERTGDVAVLLHRFLAQFAEAGGTHPPRVSPEALAALEAYRWPGNVRELRNLAQRLVVLDEDGRITLADLPPEIRGWADGAPDAGGAPPAYEEARDVALRDFRRAYVRRLLEHHDGNITRAAAAAGVSRRTLHRWLADDGLGEEEPA